MKRDTSQGTPSFVILAANTERSIRGGRKREKEEERDGPLKLVVEARMVSLSVGESLFI